MAATIECCRAGEMYFVALEGGTGVRGANLVGVYFLCWKVNYVCVAWREVFIIFVGWAWKEYGVSLAYIMV